MHRPRRLFLAFVATAVCVPAVAAHVTADAANTAKKRVKPVCKLVTDGSGDAKGTGTAVATPSSDANLDIISADVATNVTTLTGVVRVSKLATNDSMAPTGWQYMVTFGVGDTTTSINAVFGPGGTSWNGGKGTGKIIAKKKEIHISVPLSQLSVPITPGTVITGIGARTYRVGGSDQVALGLVDTADTSKTYLAGAKSCVKPGA
jgi:hypothetical protein